MLGRLHVLTDFVFQQRFSHAELARRALAGGADVIQFRQKAGALRAKLHELRPVVAACRSAGVPLLVDDHLDLALAVGADGVHLGQEDLPLPDARRVLGAAAIIGATATTLAQARRAEAEGATYLGFGPVFSGRSKAAPASTKGLDGLATVCAAVSIPVVAIGGVTADRVAAVLAAGAHGVAVMTAISTADDVEAATRAFSDALSAALS